MYNSCVCVFGVPCSACEMMIVGQESKKEGGKTLNQDTN